MLAKMHRSAKSAQTERRHSYQWFTVINRRGYGWTVDRPPAIVVVPESPDGRLWLIRIRRPVLGWSSWELPGGGLNAGERVVQGALRELEEECGLIAARARAGRIVLEALPGMGRQPHHVVFAMGVVPRAGKPVPQREEGVEAVRRFDRRALQRLVRQGEIRVLPTLGALAIAGWLGKLGP